MTNAERQDRTAIRAVVMELASRPSGALRTDGEAYGYSLDDMTLAFKYATNRGLLFSLRRPHGIFVYFTSAEARDKYAAENLPVYDEPEAATESDSLDDPSVDKRTVTIDFSNAKFTTLNSMGSDYYCVPPEPFTRPGSLDFKKIRSLGINNSEDAQ